MHLLHCTTAVDFYDDSQSAPCAPDGTVVRLHGYNTQGAGSCLSCRLPHFTGVGEAGCFPNMTSSLARWFPVSEGVKAEDMLSLGARWCGALGT